MDYRLIEELGSGGMGVVYRALRADENYLKSVAIKLMRGEFASQFSLARFRVERQVMAGLEHPNIARLLDGGSTEDGMPYLVMELIEGRPLDQYCDQHRLSIAERLKLFRTTCAAVHFAHQHLVIHRDLKPANVLVPKDGVVKLLDFGIAKILDPKSFPQVVDPTAPLMRLLSPDYASPEQVRGQTITTASDVYSLEVLLYVLLTGFKPYACSTSNLAYYASMICDTVPARPSQAIFRPFEPEAANTASEDLTPEAVSALRSTQPKKLRRALEGNLDTIILKCLCKEPERRYASVEQLSEDIGRHLEGLRITARPDTLRYRASKFVQRHKTLVAASGAIAVCLIGGIAVTLREAHRADAERAVAVRRVHDVRELARSNVFELVDSLRQLPGSAPAQHLAIQNALKYPDELNTESNDPDLTAELSKAYEKIGDLQGEYIGAGI